MLFVAEQHTPLPYVIWSSSVVQKSGERITVNITCDAGHKYPNGELINTMECNTTTYEWDYANYMPCLGKWIIVVITDSQWQSCNNNNNNNNNGRDDDYYYDDDDYDDELMELLRTLCVIL